MKSVVPHTFRTSAIVDGETINGNLRRQASDVARNLDARYTYIPPIIVPFDGVTNALTTQLRTVLFNRPSSTNPIEIVRVEFFVYAASGVTWTLSANQLGGALTPPWGSITLATAGLTTEAYAVSTTVIPVSTFGVQFEVSGSAAGAITRGWIVLHCRADRGVQGAAPNHSSYTPTYVDAASSSAGSVLDTQLTALATAVTNDATNVLDLRCQCFLARNFTTTQMWNLPSGAGMTGLGFNGNITSAAATSFTTAGTISAVLATGTGTTANVTITGTVSNTVDAPLTTASDVTITMGTVAGTVSLGYIFVWWS